MACPRTEDLSALVDHALPARRQAALKRHLDACPLCRQQLDALQALRLQLQGLPSPALGFDLAAQLQDRLQRRRARRGVAAWLPDWLPAGLAAGAALASGLWLGGLLLGPSALVATPAPALARVFDPVPPGGLCAAAEICRLTRSRP